MWNKLYNEAVKVQNGRTISPFIDAGGVAAAILTKQGNIYVGVCIDTASTLGMCAERNAIANMITNGESQIDKVVAVSDDNGIKVADEVNGASVSAKVLKQGKDKKVIVFKMKPKKGYRKKQGHRQPYTKIQIEKISG